MVLFLATTAGAATLAPEDAARLMRVLRPQVEHAAGRSFRRLPALVVTDSESALERLVASQSALAPWIPRDRLQSSLGRAVGSSFGMYVSGDDRLYLLTDVLAEAFREERTPADMLIPVARCVLAHELAHAVAAEHAPPGDVHDLASWRAHRLWSEGFASLIQSDICGDGHDALGQFVTESLQGIEHLDLRILNSHNEVLYGAGREWLRELRAREGMEAVWAAAHDPPSPEAILADLEAPPPPTTAQLRRRSAVYMELFWGIGGRGTAREYDPLTTLSAAHGRTGWEAAQAMRGGWSARVVRHAGDTAFGVYRFDGRPEIPLTLVDGERLLVAGETDNRKNWLASTVGLRRLAGVDAAMKQGTDLEPGTARRLWVAAGDELIVVTTTDPAVTAGRMKSAVRVWLATDPLTLAAEGQPS